MNYTFQHVCIESFGYVLPDEIWTSEEVESRLAPLYERLKLPLGRLELMTGIRERRFWQRGTLPGDISLISCERALEQSEIDRDCVGALIHGSVCRDYLEPATACSIHHRLGLRPECTIYDTSNACLGILNGVLQSANMIELGQIDAALVVGTEDGRGLVENTIQTLNEDTSLTRKSIKPAIASLTIGSASCAILLTRRSLSHKGNRLEHAVVQANTQHSELCQSDASAAGHVQPLMDTDSEMLMRHGIETGTATFARFLKHSGWTRDSIHRTVCHQVGGKHRALMLESIGMPPEKDFTTFEWLGNTGAAALPVTMAIGLESAPATNERIAMLGIGSGINCISLGVHWAPTA